MCVAVSTHYILSGSFETNSTLKKGLNVFKDTGTGYNIICIVELPLGLKECIDTEGRVLGLNDANLKPFSMSEMVCMMVQFCHTHYKINFVVV